MQKNIFEPNDRVFHILHGWGNVISCSDIGARVKFDDDIHDRLIVFDFLSFTEYKFEGFSIDRPEILPEFGQVVWVRDENDDEWEVTHFIKKDGPCYDTCESNPFSGHYSTWRYLTTKNPYLNEN